MDKSEIWLYVLRLKSDCLFVQDCGKNKLSDPRIDHLGRRFEEGTA